MILEMEQVQDPVSRPKLVSAKPDKQNYLTDSDKFTKITHSTLTQNHTSGIKNIPS